ncbi:MAG: hypothetical protein DRO39_07515 [Thermoprotei archaeon]|nr:MAG: hypothetical protein DRO39_07515 [Thermoprotei archaeon]
MTLVPLHDPLRLATYTPISPADVIVFREGDYAVAVDGKTKEVIARSTDHADVLREAVNHVHAEYGGGKIHLDPREYIIESLVDVPGQPYKAGILLKDNTILEGSGIGATVLKLGDAVGGSVIAFESVHRVAIMNLKIDGNKANNTDSGVDGDLCGIRGHASWGSVIRDVWIVNTVREGLYVTNCGWNCYEDVIVQYAGRTGIELDSPDYLTAVDLKALNNDLYGIELVGGATREELIATILGGEVYGNAHHGVHVIHTVGGEIIGITSRANGSPDYRQDGILVEDTEGLAIIGCHAYENYRCGIYVYSSDRVAVIGCKALNNNQAGYSDGHGIRLYDATYCIVKGNLAYDNQDTPKQQYGVSEEGASDYNLIIGNILKPNAVGGLTTVGTNTVQANNIT